MALSEKKRISNDRWIKDNYRQVKLSMPKAEAEALDTYCSSHNLSKAGFIRAAIKEKMKRDSNPEDNIENNSGAIKDAHTKPEGATGA